MFGLQALQNQEGLAIGRTDTHVAIWVGRWIFCFLIDTGRFPDTAKLVPRAASATTRFRFDPQDAEYFLANLGKRLKAPGSKDLAVTLELNEAPCFRFESDGQVLEMPLTRSQVTGKNVRLCLDLKRFLRALELQFTAFEVRDPDEQPLVACDGQRVFITMPLIWAASCLAASRFEPTRGR